MNDRERKPLFIANKELNEFEIRTGKTMLDSKPRMLMVVLTNRCNLECIMCTRTSKQDERTLPFDSIKQIKDLFPYVEMIDWQGGEVFLVDYFKELFSEASNYPHINQSIVTNGLFINDSWGKELNHAFRLNLTYSIDAVTKQTYEYIRKGARFEILVSSLEKIKEINASRINNPIQLHINAVVMRSNYKELVFFPRFCKQYGISHLRFDFLRSQTAPLEDIILKGENEATAYLQYAIEEIKKECRKMDIWFECTFASLLPGVNGMCENLLPVAEGINSVSTPLKCKLPWKKMYIDAAGNGIVRPDCLCEQNAGNILEMPLEEIWNSAVMQ
ncbi:MAG: radical SAM protein, partial [Candidatus Omnitrophica bacterium]|nr:radical SAM protein [Candidatus Omnitrophota bacterium]